MSEAPLPRDSASYTRLAIAEKERWHRRQARMSFQKKLRVLDRLRESAAWLRELHDAKTDE